MQSTPLLRLTRSTMYSIEQVGGKAFNLQFLLQNNIPIPLTFVLEAKSIKHILGLDHVPKSIFASLPSDMHYAVRSSGIAEDNINHSYAGMFDSYLNVSHKELSKHILLCARSTLNHRLVSYEKKLGLNSNNRMAVIVQEMFPAEFAGICFTIHPIKNDGNLIVIELGFGLGDKVVSGKISPITFIIDKSTCEILESDFGQHCDLDLSRFIPVLKNLREYAINIELLYGHPIDIEWAVKGDNIIILQVRPVTCYGDSTNKEAVGM